MGTLHHHFAYPLDLHNKDKNPPSLNSHSLLDLQHTSESFQGFSSSRLKSLKRHHSSSSEIQGSNHPKRLLSILSSSHIPPLTSSRVPLTTSYYIAESCHWKEIFSWTSPSGPSKT